MMFQKKNLQKIVFSWEEHYVCVISNKDETFLYMIIFKILFFWRRTCFPGFLQYYKSVINSNIYHHHQNYFRNFQLFFAGTCEIKLQNCYHAVDIGQCDFTIHRSSNKHQTFFFIKKMISWKKASTESEGAKIIDNYD